MNEINPERLPVSDLVRTSRRSLNMTQEELAKAVDKSRGWIIQLEKGARYKEGALFTLEPMICLRLADVLNLDPTVVLTAADIPKSEWPNFSNMVAKSAIVKTIDVTTLSHTQERLIRDLVEEIKRGNWHAENDKKDPTP